MSGKKASTSTAGASADSAQSNIEEENGGEKTSCSTLAACALQALSASTPEVQIPLDFLGDPRTSQSIRELRSMPEGFRDETDPEKQSNTPGTELSASPGTSQTLASATLQSTDLVQERPRSVMKQKGESPTFQHGMDSLPGPSQGSQAPTFNLTESTPVTTPEHITSEITTCYLPNDYSLRSYTIPVDPDDPNRLRVHTSQARINENDTVELPLCVYPTCCVDDLGGLLVIPCPHMWPHRRYFGCVGLILLICVIVAIICVVGYNKQRRHA